MPDPLEEEIAQNVKTTVEGVTEEAGYNQTVAEVHRLSTLEGFEPVNLHVVMLEDPPERDREQTPAGAHTWRKVFGLVLYVRPSDTDTSPVDTKINRFRADVAKALMSDQTRGGYAVDTDVLDTAVVTDEQGRIQGHMLPVEVTYRHLETDPYTQVS